MAEQENCAQQAPSFDQLAQELGLEELEKCLAEDCASPFEAAEKRFKANKAGQERVPVPCARRYALFKLLVQEKEGRLRWQALKEHEPGKFWDTDSQVVDLWKKVEADCPEKDLAAGHWSVIYHRVWLFEWLLRRYDVRRARSVVGGGRWAANAHLFVLAAVVAVFVVRCVGWFGAYQTQWAALLTAVAYAAALAGLTKVFHNRLPDRLEALAVATHSLIPRLAGAGAVGLLFVASSEELLPVILSTKWWWLLGLLAASYGYLLLEMARRIHPLPRLPRLLLHGADLAATGLTHSLALTLLAEGALRKVLAGNGGSYPPLGWRESVSVVVFVFSIGLVVNLIWAEQPVTEPL
jgi:hypothetical protein